MPSVALLFHRISEFGLVDQCFPSAMPGSLYHQKAETLLSHRVKLLL